MKKTIQVVHTATYEIEIDDNLLTPESIKEFEEFMFPLDSSDAAGVFKLIAEQRIRDEYLTHSEGLGRVGRVGSAAPIQIHEVYSEIEFND